MKILYNFLRSIMLPLGEIDRHAPKAGNIIEFGCGEGVISAYLAQNPKRKVLGIDINGDRLPKFKTKNLTFNKQDITKYKMPKTNCVVISDVLHHLNYKNQDLVLKNIYQGLKKGGVLVVKEIDTGEFIRSTLSRTWDFLLYPKENIYFNDANKLKTKMTHLGFKIKMKRVCRFFPGSTTLFICKKS